MDCLASAVERRMLSRVSLLVALIAVALTVCVSSNTWAAAWGIQETPAAERLGETLGGASCTSERFCVAVGQISEERRIEEELILREATLAEGWNGSTWAIQSTPNPRRGTRNHLRGVSCTSERFCVAVGEAFISNGIIGGTIIGLAERWNGREWAIQEIALPPEASTSVHLLGVSCTSESACTAVGWYQDRRLGGSHLLVERWNGREWAVQTTPNVVGAFSAVSCSSATACTTVDLAAMVADSWDGREWTQQEMPSPSRGNNFNLGVSCASARACVSVGEWETGTGANAFSEIWDGTRWTLQTPPSPAGARATRLEGVSCTSTSACTGVGAYTEASGTLLTLAESWNGREWTIQTTPNRRGATQSYLVGISCTSATLCTAAGVSLISGVFEALVERYS